MKFVQLYADKLVMAASVLVVIILYLPMLGNGFVWDDQYSFFQHPMYRDPANIVRALTGALIYQDNLFRPLPVLTFLIQIHVFEISAFSMHVVSLVLHALNTFLVMFIGRQLFQRLNIKDVTWLMILTGLLYGLHPALIEPVSFVSARFDMMMTFFVLAALTTDIQLANKASRPWVVGSLFLLAALCKEMALGFAIALPFWHIFIRGKGGGLRDHIRLARESGDIRVYVSVFGFGLVYLLLRFLALGTLFDIGSYSNNLSWSFPEHIALIGLSVFTYFRLLVFPVGNLSVAHPLPEHLGLADAHVLLGFTFIVLVLAAAGYFREHRWQILSGFAAILGSLFPVLNVVPMPRGAGAFFSELFLVLPAAFFVLVLATSIARLSVSWTSGSRNIAFAFKAGMLVWFLLAAFTIQTMIPVWKNNISLWTWAKYAGPENMFVHNNLAAALLSAKRYPEAESEAGAAVNLDQGSEIAWNNLALSLLGQEKYVDAEVAAIRAISLDPGKNRNYLTLGKIYYYSKSYDEAERIFVDILAREPANISAQIFLAYVYRDTGRFKLAEQHMQRAITMLPVGPGRRILVKWMEELRNANKR